MVLQLYYRFYIVHKHNIEPKIVLIKKIKIYTCKEGQWHPNKLHKLFSVFTLKKMIWGSSINIKNFHEFLLVD